MIKDSDSVVYQCNVCVEAGNIGATPCRFSFEKDVGIIYKNIELSCPVVSIKSEPNWYRIYQENLSVTDVSDALVSILSTRNLSNASAFMDDIYNYFTDDTEFNHELNNGQINFIESDDVMITISIESINLNSSIIYFYIRDLRVDPDDNIVVSFDFENNQVISVGGGSR